jgi:hypothetical protein
VLPFGRSILAIYLYASAKVIMTKMGKDFEQQHVYAIREWLIGILRFAITLELSDRATILNLAAELDRLASLTKNNGFTFFARTSVQLCNALIARNCPESVETLRGFLGRIDHLPLRRAFEAVLDVKPSRPDRRDLLRRSRENLWKGLPIAGTEPASHPQVSQLADTPSSGTFK